MKVSIIFKRRGYSHKSKCLTFKSHTKKAIQKKPYYLNFKRKIISYILCLSNSYNIFLFLISEGLTFRFQRNLHVSNNISI